MSKVLEKKTDGYDGPDTDEVTMDAEDGDDNYDEPEDVNEEEEDDVCEEKKKKTSLPYYPANI